MELYKVVFYSSELVDFCAATTIIEKVMDWDWVNAYWACKEADLKGSCLLCFTIGKKAQDYVTKLEEEGLFAEQISI